MLLTNKIDNQDEVLKLKKESQKKNIENKPKEKVKNKEINLNIKDHKSLNKTTDLAVIIKKLKNIRDKKINKTSRL